MPRRITWGSMRFDQEAKAGVRGEPQKGKAGQDKWLRIGQVWGVGMVFNCQVPGSVVI